MSCESKNIYASIAACPGEISLPGIRRRLYFIPKADIAAYPTLPAPASGADAPKMEELAKYKGDLTLKEGKFFSYIDLKDEASNVTFESVGESGSKLFNNQANAVVSGQKDLIKGFAREANNDDILYVYQDHDGKFCVIGNEAFSTNTVPSGDTSAESTGAVTTTLAISCYDSCPVPTYTGKLAISATEYIDCATGKVEAAAG